LGDGDDDEEDDEEELLALLVAEVTLDKLEFIVGVVAIIVAVAFNMLLESLTIFTDFSSFFLSSISSSPSGSYSGGVSGAFPSSISSGVRPPITPLPRSAQTPAPVDSSKSALSSPKSRSNAHRVLIALLYLVAVAVLVGSLLWDRSSCQPGASRNGAAHITK